MTIDEVMALSGRELDAAVAERIGVRLYWHEYYLTGDGKLTKCGPYLNAQGNGESVNREVLRYSTDWAAAMQVREWARGLDYESRLAYLDGYLQCVQHRTGRIAFPNAILYAEPIDYSRAALLVEG